MPCAKAGRVCIVEVEEIVEAGAISAEDIHLPSIYVQRVVKGASFEKRIEVRVGGTTCRRSRQTAQCHDLSILQY